jgi:hypothetical protein
MVLAVVLSVLVALLMIRFIYRLCTSKADALKIITARSDSYSIQNGLSDEQLNDVLLAYDHELEVPPTEYKMCKSEFK